MNAPGKPGRKLNFYARWVLGLDEAGSPVLNLDLVPTGKPGEACIYFRGKPLAGIKATLRPPDEVEKEITADSDGTLRFEPEQSGQYLLSVARHRESLSGFHLGQAYDLSSHNLALT